MKSTDSQRLLKSFTRLKYLLALMQWMCVFSGSGMIYQAFYYGKFPLMLLSVVFFYLCWHFYKLGNLFIMEVFMKQRDELKVLKEMWADIRRANLLKSQVYFKMQTRKMIK